MVIIFTIAGTKVSILRDQALAVDWSLKTLKTFIWQPPKHKKNHRKLLHVKMYILIVIFTPVCIRTCINIF